MNAQERLQLVIAEQRERLRRSVPQDREAALVALLQEQELEREQDQLPRTPLSGPSAVVDLVTGPQIENLGGNTALALCLTAPGDGTVVPDEVWAAAFRARCGEIEAAELVLAHCETGFMRMVDDGVGSFNAWIASKRAPTSWLERADFAWWAAWRARQQPERGRGAAALLQQMSHQAGYPPTAVIGGSTLLRYAEVLEWLQRRALALAADGRGATPTVHAEQALVAALAAELRIEAALVAQVVSAFTLDEENAAYHAAVPGVAAAPLVRVAPGRLVLSRYGLSSEPLLFLMRELRRREGQAYYNTAHLRETVFREELYALFADKRFVTSSSRIELRRDSGNIRTDIDAVVFDRKTGTLGFFELKSQDPFARSTAELSRQRDNVLYANRQVAGVLAWLNRKGAADELLNRVDRGTAQKFRVNRVYPFVLGRYLVHFGDLPGAEPDRRAAWGTWPQVLRLLEGQPAGANPLASLFTRLSKDPSLVTPPTTAPAQEIAIGGVRLTVHATQTAWQASQAARTR